MLLPELWEYVFTLCSSKDRSILCQVSSGWCTMAIKVSSMMSPLGELYYNTTPCDDELLYKSGDYHLIVRLKRKYDDLYTICQSSNIDVVNLTITLGANDWDWGLRGACRGGQLKLANSMITHGATNWNEGLYEACVGGRLKLAKLMISYGATICYNCNNNH